jgi:predicted ATPase
MPPPVLPAGIHLRSIQVREWPARLDDEFPFRVPVIRELPMLNFPAQVTFFVGENGSGKSTLLEAIACAVRAVTVGSESVRTDPTLAAQRALAQQFRLTWNKRTRKGFFLRAEDFFGYARSLSKMRAELERDLRAVDNEYRDRSEAAIGLAKLPYQSELGALQRRYGEGLDSGSHGEGFMRLFQERFVPGGLYLLDEPEAPLSPIRQLAFLAALKQMVAQAAQFIIATHSPILLAFPGAQILSFDCVPIRTVKYEDLEHVTLTRSFLENPEAYLKHL